MAFYKIKMFGTFASDLESMFFGEDGLITFKNVQTELKNAGGSDIEVDLSSVGGLVDVATDIFLAFRAYKRDYPKSQLILNIKTQAASAASFFADGEFWDLITVEDISSYMLHNPANYVGGDYRIMQENADYLKRLSALYAGTYAAKSKKSQKEIQTMMDKTTWLYGQEIVDAGFADEVISTANDKNKDSDFAKMQMKYKSMMMKIQQIEMKKEDLEKAVAMLDGAEKSGNAGPTEPATKPNEKPAESGNNNQEEVTMTSDELKKANPETFASIESAGVEKGKADTIANSKAIMELKNKTEYKGLIFIQERCDAAIMSGEKIEDLKMSLMALMIDPKNQASMESPGSINGGGSDTASGEQGKDETPKNKW
jgi:ATP-dependent protease ClpP protease subunit